MKAVEFPFAGVVILHVRRGDVVVRGQTERTTGQLLAKAASEQEAIVVEDDVTHLYAKGDLSLNLPSGTSVQVVGHAQDVVLRTLGDVTLETCHGDLVASEIASLQIQTEVHGDVALRTASGPTMLGNVHGDMALAAVTDVRAASVEGDVSINGAGNVVLGRVQGDLVAHHVNSVEVRSVAGNASVKNVSGAIDLKTIEGDLSVTLPGSALAASSVQGDASISGELQAGGKYWINAAGDVAARIGGNVQVVVQSKGRIHTGADVQVLSEASGRLEARIGATAPESELNIEAGGDVTVQSWGQGGWPAADVATSQIQQAVSQAQTEAEHALAQAQEELRRAVQETEEAIPDRLAGAEAADTGGEASQRASAVGMAGGGASATWRSLLRDLFDSLDPHRNKSGTTETSAPPKDEVRTVLDMLSAGRITAEEAERLLDALRP